MGFLNPFIYKHGHAFHDVTIGVNSAGTRHGFTAVAGWDAASGLGTPNFHKLSAAAAAVFRDDDVLVAQAVA